mgnify:CR=1 FL=1|tara:strand:- start:138 stop:809 length:672 start_codon:yes stop_codon:yes gene_type:complete
MGSTRLPEKMSLNLCGYDLIDWVIRRSLKSNFINKFFLATSHDKKNKYLVKKSKQYNIQHHMGSENDVLSRFIDIAKSEDADLIVRICADNPLICPLEIDRLIQNFLEIMPDYAFNHIPALGNDYVDGVGAEAISYNALMQISASTTNKEQKEHVTKYIWDNKNKFHIHTFSSPNNLQFPKISLDVDTKNDLLFLQNLIQNDKSWVYPEDIVVSNILKSIPNN